MLVLAYIKARSKHTWKTKVSLSLSHTHTQRLIGETKHARQTKDIWGKRRAITITLQPTNGVTVPMEEYIS